MKRPTKAGPATSAVPIGQAAASAGVSARTLRYYEQVGLVTPCGHSAGGARRYSDDDIARIRRIRELQELLGSDLDEIREILTAEDRLAALRAEYRAVGRPGRRHREILDEATVINAGLQDRVRSRIDRLGALLAELQDRRARYDVRRAELDAGLAGEGRAGRNGAGRP